MAGELVRCEGCKRHVFAKEAACPFCHASLGGSGLGLAAVALTAGLSLAGCPAPPAPVYGGPPVPVETPTGTTVTTAPTVVQSATPPPPRCLPTECRPP